MVVVGIYEDHEASREADNIEYKYLCDECAATKCYVTLLSTEPAGNGAECDECQNSNVYEEEDEEEDY